MSHVSTCDTKMDDKQAVKDACKELGLTVKENATADLGFGNRVHADLVITLPDGKQIGLVWNAKKKLYDIKIDDYHGTIRRFLGGDLHKLKQAHSVKKLERVARAQGFRVTKGKVDAKTGDQEMFLFQL